MAPNFSPWMPKKMTPIVILTSNPWTSTAETAQFFKLAKFFKALNYFASIFNTFLQYYCSYGIL